MLSLTGVNNNGPYAWLTSDLPPVGDSGLNETWLDGDAFYVARSQLGDPAIATPDGLLVTTVEFVALAESPGAVVSIPETLGAAETIVIDGIPALDVHGTLGSATVTVVSALPGDCDDNGDVDLDDYADFEVCLLGPVGGLGEECVCFDFDASGHVDLKDFAGVQMSFTG